MKRFWILCIAVLTVGLAMAAVGPVGQVNAPSGTSVVSRTYTTNANNLMVYAWTADVQVVIHPLRSADQDTFIFRAGRAYPPLPIRHNGFDVIRSTATPVDVSWW